MRSVRSISLIAKLLSCGFEMSLVCGRFQPVDIQAISLAGTGAMQSRKTLPYGIVIPVTRRLAGDDADARDRPLVYHRFSSGGDNGATPTAAWETRQGDQCVLEHGHSRARR